MSIGQTEMCRNRIGHRRKGRRRCEINFIPLVQEVGDLTFTQRLECRSGLEGFGKCRTSQNGLLNKEDDKCTNSGRCSSQSGRPRPLPGLIPDCFEKCDYAVLISGGWNVLMNHPRHLENIREVWNYLKSKGFLERNIKVFYANNGSIDCKFLYAFSSVFYAQGRRTRYGRYGHGLTKISHILFKTNRILFKKQ